MSDSERDPHVLISARISYHPRVLRLPSDAARWGWIVLLGEAKTQRPPGRFASLAVLRRAAGQYRRFIGAYLEAGLLHDAGHSCGRCATPAEEFVVHDWPRHQDRKSRVQEWRTSVGLSSGRETLGETGGKQVGNSSTRAAPRALQSQSLSSYGEGGAGGDDGRPDLEAFLLVRRRAPTPRQRNFLDAYQATFDVSGPARAERLILSHPDDPIGALKADLEEFRRTRLAEVEAAERKPPPARHGSGLPESARELLAHWQAQAEVKP